jgi:Pvc16 N-terminal domain
VYNYFFILVSEISNLGILGLGDIQAVNHHPLPLAAMIGHALEIIVKELNAYIGQRRGHDDLVVMERLVDGKGDFTARTVGKVCCSLVNMEEERIVKHQAPVTDGFGTRQNPNVMVNLYLLFAVNTPTDGSTHDAYLQGLRLLSLVVSFFQGKAQFTAQNTPDMHPALRQLSMELYPLTIENQNHLWAGLGAKYLPSALYKLRLVALRDDSATGLEPVISTIHIEQGGPS